MFLEIRAEIEDRFRLLRHAFALSRGSPKEPSALVKGLVFVQMYAIYEFAVRSAAEEAIKAINSANCSLDSLRPSMLAIYLDGEFQSLRDCGRKDVWSKRLQIAERATSKDIAIASTSILPHLGQHFRTDDLQFLFRVLGICRMPVRRKSHFQRINEVVRLRNDIAHGLETADKIGRNFTRADIRHRIDQMDSICRCVVSIIESHCSSSTNFTK